MKVGHLRTKLIGRLGTVGFVLRENLGAESLSRDIEGDGNMGWLLIF